MQQNLDEFDEEPRVRPTFLTILCILTFIGSGWAIASSFYAYSTADKTAQMFKSMNSGKDSTYKKDTTLASTGNKKRGAYGLSMMLSVSKLMTADSLRKSSIGTIISGIFTLVGALLMWWLRRKGFYLYIIGIAIGIGVPFYLYGGNLMAVGLSSFSGFFGIVFIALYALNIKSMR